MSVLLKILALLSVIVFAVSVAVTRGDAVPDWELAVFEWFRNWPDFLQPFFLTVTQLGGVHVLFIILLLLVILRTKLLLQLLVAGVISGALVWAGKLLAGRARPEELITGLIRGDLFWSGDGGFPSGHTAMVVAIGVVLMLHLPKIWRLPIVGMMLLVAVSRIYLGMHLPLDLVGGAAIGIIAVFLTQLVINLTEKLMKK